MASLSGFNANEVTPLSPREPLPPGKYAAVIVASELKGNRAGTGSFLEMTFEVIDGPFAGRTVKTRLNLHNPSAQAVEIARGELSAICRAVGVTTPQDSTELHGLPLVITLRVVKRSDNGEPANEVAGYAPRQANGSAANTSTNTSGNNSSASGVEPGRQATPPWKRTP